MTQTTSLLSSPNEMLAAIASLLPPSSLYSLSLTNHRLQNILAPFLHAAFLTHKDSILLWSARRNDAPTMTLAISHGASIPFHTLLHSAGRHNRDATARVLLDASATFVLQRDELAHMLFRALWRRHTTVARLLLSRGAVADSPAFRAIALSIAVLGDKIELVNLLLEYGADATLIRHPKRRFMTAVRQGNVLVVKVFLDAGFLPEMRRSTRNGHPVHAVARFGNLDMMRLVVQYGGSVDARGKYGCCALHQTVLYPGRDEMRRFLLEQEADVDMKDDKGYTPLHTAVCRGKVPAVRMLLEYGADVGMVTRYEWHPVRARGGRAMLGTREDVRKVLVEFGVLQESS